MPRWQFAITSGRGGIIGHACRLLKREVKEEAGIEIEDQLSFINDVFFVRPDGIPVILVKFAAKYRAGEVKPEKGAFTEAAWVNQEEIEKYDCIQGIAAEVMQTSRS